MTATNRRPLVLLVSGKYAALPSGDNALSTYVHDQSSVSATWTIVHGLDCFPSVTVVDSAGTVVNGGISYTSRNQLVLTFSAAFSGKAYLN